MALTLSSAAKTILGDDAIEREARVASTRDASDEIQRLLGEMRRIAEGRSAGQEPPKMCHFCGRYETIRAYEFLIVGPHGVNVCPECVARLAVMCMQRMGDE